MNDDPLHEDIMAIVDIERLSYRYGKTQALRDLTLQVNEGSIYGLLGRNGSGKTTLLQILAGLRHPASGVARVLGKDVRHFSAKDRIEVGYIAEGQQLPGWMRLGELEAYLAPLYPTWDAALANTLRARFGLNATQRVKTLSRGEQMKATLLCALAPRPKLLIMDEPFTGIDVLTKDDLVRGLLESSGREGWTVLICSHDIGELDLLIDAVGIIDRGQLLLSDTMDAVRERFAAKSLREVFVELTRGAGHGAAA